MGPFGPTLATYKREQPGLGWADCSSFPSFSQNYNRSQNIRLFGLRYKLQYPFIASPDSGGRSKALVLYVNSSFPILYLYSFVLFFCILGAFITFPPIYTYTGYSHLGMRVCVYICTHRSTAPAAGAGVRRRPFDDYWSGISAKLSAGEASGRRGGAA